MLLRESSERLQNEFRYIRDLNLNAIRLEGKMETDAFTIWRTNRECS